MCNSQILNWRRLGLLMRNDIVSNMRVILIAVSAILALILIHIPNSSFLAWILFVGGLWITSSSFSDLHNQQRIHYYLTLPASQLEKVLNRWLFTAVFYPICISAIYLLSYTLTSAMPLSIPLYNIAEWLKLYFILQSIFFLGSIYFKSHSVIKTIASMAIFSLILSVYLLMWIWIFHTGSPFLYYPHFESFWFILPIYCWVLSYIRFTESENA